MLQVVEDSDDPNVGNQVLREKGPRNAVSSLTEQINLFWREDYPFRVLDHEKIDNPLKWWVDMARNDHANVLGVSHQFLYFEHRESVIRFSPSKSSRSWSTPCQMNELIQL
jgi:hypothetical protein